MFVTKPSLSTGVVRSVIHSSLISLLHSFIAHTLASDTSDRSASGLELPFPPLRYKHAAKKFQK